MKSLLSLNPMIWHYRGRLLLGVVFVVLTNIFAVWAPSMIGEGVNALNDANRDFLVPLEQGVDIDELSERRCACRTTCRCSLPSLEPTPEPPLRQLRVKMSWTLWCGLD